MPGRAGLDGEALEVDHVTVFSWVQRFTPLLADAARFCRHAPGDRWYVDETYAKVNGVWPYVYRAVDEDGQVVDVLVSARRDAAAAHRFRCRAMATLKVRPTEVVTDAAPTYPTVLDELVPSAWHHVERHESSSALSSDSLSSASSPKQEMSTRSRRRSARCLHTGRLPW